MDRDLVLTWPKKIPLFKYLSELYNAERADLLINYRVSQPPRLRKDAWRERPPHVYMVHDGYIRGYNNLKEILRRDVAEVINPHTGEYMSAGWYIVRYPHWFPLPEPVAMTGFRGFRYIDGNAITQS